MMKRCTTGFGFATLLVISFMTDIIKGVPDASFHSKVGVGSTWTALVIDWLVLATLATLAVFWAHRNLRLKLFFTSLLFPVLVLGNRFLVGSWAAKLWNRSSLFPSVVADPAVALSLHGVVFVALVWVGFLWTLFLWFPRLYRGVLAGCSIVLVSSSIMGCVAAIDLARSVVRHRRDVVHAPLFARDTVKQAQHARLVWVLLDEMSYDQAVEHRASDLQMPALDSLLAQSTVFSDVRPAGYYTDNVIPSLLLGTEMSDKQFSGINNLFYQQVSDKRWIRFDAKATVLADAEKDDWNVAVVGWYIPYCNEFAGMLQHCYWRLSETKNPMRGDEGVWWNMLAPLRQSFHVWRHPPLLEVKLEDEEALMARGAKEISDDQMDFVFIHIPVPHPPSIWDHKAHAVSLTWGNSYEDGLARADMVIATLMDAAQASSRWHNTTVIINGDHSWRTQMWQNEGIWTQADGQLAARKKFDDRPFLLIHSPGQSSSNVVTQPFPLIDVHAVVETVLQSGVPSW